MISGRIWIYFPLLGITALEDKFRLHAASLPTVLFTLLVFLVLSWMLCVCVYRMERVAAPCWLRAALFIFQIATLVQLLGFLEELIEVELTDNILLGMKFALLQSLCECENFYKGKSSVIVTNRCTSLNVQDTALPLLSTIGRLIISRPPWKSTREGNCLARGDVLTLYLFRNNAWAEKEKEQSITMWH